MIRLSRNQIKGAGYSFNDTKSIQELYETYAPGLLSLCFRYCGKIEDAEDVLHDGFIKIIKNGHSFQSRNVGSFEGWMKKIMVNTALNFLRDHAKEKRFIDIDPIYDRINISEEEENQFEELTGKIDQKSVMNMICELPPGYRTVFNLYVFESYTHREIAQELNISENTSKSQLSKARGLLKKRISELLIKQENYYEK
jgi:RNA polymerase sigma-70 factor, ECF subfamily